MSDDRLFASNNAIGRKWYFLNLIILAFLFVVTDLLFKKYVIPHTTTETYTQIAQGMLYFAYLIYIVTFFALIERRLFDITGDRDSKFYKNISGIMKLIVVIQIIVMIFRQLSISLPLSNELIWLIIMIADSIFLLLTIAIGFIKGKISNLTYEEYKKKIKYLN